MRIAKAFGITVDELYAPPAECLAAALPHLDDAPIAHARDDSGGEGSRGKVTPIKKKPSK